MRKKLDKGLDDGCGFDVDGGKQGDHNTITNLTCVSLYEFFPLKMKKKDKVEPQTLILTSLLATTTDSRGREKSIYLFIL